MKEIIFDNFCLNFGIEILSGAYVTLGKEWNAQNVCDPFSRLYYVRQGNGVLKYGEKIIPLKKEMAYFIPAKTVFSYECDYLEKIYFHITANNIEKYDVFSSACEIFCLPFEKDKFKQLYSACFSDNYIELLKIKTIIYETITAVIDSFNLNKIPIKKYSDSVIMILKYIQENQRINLTLHEISETLYISESKLRKIFHDETNMSIGKYIDDLVFLKAQKLLADKNKSIASISSELGFCDRFYFSRRFKELFHKTPYEYRKEINS